MKTHTLSHLFLIGALSLSNVSCIDWEIFSQNSGSIEEVHSLGDEERLSAQQREVIRSSNRDLVSQCYAAIQSNEPVEVDFFSSEICRRPSRYTGNRAKYRLIRNENGTIGLNVRLNLIFDSEFPFGNEIGELFADGRHMVQMVRDCVPQIQSVFRRYNLDLSVEIDERQFLSHDRSFDHRIWLRNSWGISTSGQWYFREFYTNDWNPRMCLKITHELGHLLSLPDEYEDPHCPDREFVSTETHPTSIMNHPYDGFEMSDFYPRHIRQILRPACPGI